MMSSGDIDTPKWVATTARSGNATENANRASRIFCSVLMLFRRVHAANFCVKYFHQIPA